MSEEYDYGEEMDYTEEEDSYGSDILDSEPTSDWDEEGEGMQATWQSWTTRGEAVSICGGSGVGGHSGLFAAPKPVLGWQRELQSVIVKQTIGKEYKQLNILSTEYRGSFVEGVVVSLVSDSIANDGVFQVFFDPDVVEVPCYTAKLFSPVLRACEDNQYHSKTTCESAATRESLGSLFKLEPLRINGDNCKFFAAIASELQIEDLLHICEELSQTLDLLDRFDVLAGLQEEIEDVDSEIKALTTYDLIMSSCLSEDIDELIRIIASAAIARPMQSEYFALLVQLLDLTIPEFHQLIIDVLFHENMSWYGCTNSFFLRCLFDIGVVTIDEIPRDVMLSGRDQAAAFFARELFERTPILYDIYRICVDTLTDGMCFEQIIDMKDHNWEGFSESVARGYGSDKVTHAIREDNPDLLQSLMQELDLAAHNNVSENVFDRFYCLNFTRRTSLLEYAALCGSLKCFKYLLLNSEDEFDTYKHLMLFAIYGGNTEIVRLVNERGYDLREHDLPFAMASHRNTILGWVLENRRSSEEIQLFDQLYWAVTTRNYGFCANLIGEELAANLEASMELGAIRGTNATAFKLLSFLPLIEDRIFNPGLFLAAASTGNLSFFSMAMTRYAPQVERISAADIFPCFLRNLSTAILKYFREKLPDGFKSWLDSDGLSHVLRVGNLEAFKLVLNDPLCTNPREARYLSYSGNDLRALPIMIEKPGYEINFRNLARNFGWNGRYVDDFLKTVMETGKISMAGAKAAEVIDTFIMDGWWGVAEAAIARPDFDPNMKYRDKPLVEYCILEEHPIVGVLLSHPFLVHEFENRSELLPHAVRIAEAKSLFIKQLSAPGTTNRSFCGTHPIDFAMQSGLTDVCMDLLYRPDIAFSVTDVIHGLIELGDLTVFDRVTDGTFGSIENGAIFNCRIGKNNTPLCLCIERNHKALFQRLISLPAIDVNYALESHVPAIVTAATVNDIFYFESLWKHPKFKPSDMDRGDIPLKVFGYGDRRKVALLFERPDLWDYSRNLFSKAGIILDPVIFEMFWKHFSGDIIHRRSHLMSLFANACHGNNSAILSTLMNCEACNHVDFVDAAVRIGNMKVAAELALRQFKSGKGAIQCEKVRRIGKIPGLLVELVKLGSVADVDAFLKVSRDRDDRDVMNAAIEQDNIEMLKLLMRSGFNPDLLGSSGLSPLMLAAKLNKDACVAVLLEDQDIDLNMSGANGETALGLAAENNSVACVKLLVKAQNIDVNRMDTVSGNTPLILACMSGHDTIEVLLGVPGINVNQANRVRVTPLIAAASVNAPAVVSRLLRCQGINVNWQNLNNKTALDIANARGFSQVAAILSGQ